MNSMMDLFTHKFNICLFERAKSIKMNHKNSVLVTV